MKALCVLATTIAVVIYTSPLHAHNTMIMPGDGAVMTGIDDETPLALKDGTLTLPYEFSPTYGIMFCGYLGYEAALIKNVDNDQYQALKEAINACQAAKKQLFIDATLNLQKRLDDINKQLSNTEERLTPDKNETSRLTQEQYDIQRQLATIQSERVYIQLFDKNTAFCHTSHNGTVSQAFRLGLRYNDAIFRQEIKYRGHPTYGQTLSDAALGYEWQVSNFLTPLEFLNKKPFDTTWDNDNSNAEIAAQSICFVVLVTFDPDQHAEGEDQFGYYVVRPDGGIEAYALDGAKLPEKDLAKYPMRLPEKDK